MKNLINLIINLFVCTIICCSVEAGTIWQKHSGDLNEISVREIVSHPETRKIMYIGTTGGLYRSADYGKSYKNILKTKTINHVFIPQERTTEIYIATDDGVYKGSNNGDTWNKIYDMKEPRAQRAFCALLVDGIVYIGTEQGLVYQKDGQREWIKESGELGSALVYKLIQDHQNVYALTDTDLYRINNKRDITKIFSVTIVDEKVVVDDSTWPDEKNKFMKDVVVDETSHPARLWLANRQGVFKSVDQGQTWQKLPSTGLPFQQVNSLAQCASLPESLKVATKNDINKVTESVRLLIAATTKGVFYFDGQQWAAQYQGMEAQNVRFVSCSVTQWQAATDLGLYYLDTVSPDIEQSREVSSGIQDKGTSRPAQRQEQAFSNEPTVQEVQRLAVRYADVSPEKISEWMRRAKLKAIVPNVSVGIDRNNSYLYHWDTGASPDQLRKGKQYSDWDVSVSWNLSDLVWNNDITSIDSRSKLSSELREDILAQVTRIYFERRRLQFEMFNKSNSQEQLDQDLRLQELTAMIDSFTNGEFSRRIERNSALRLE